VALQRFPPLLDVTTEQTSVATANSQTPRNIALEKDVKNLGMHKAKTCSNWVSVKPWN